MRHVCTIPSNVRTERIHCHRSPSLLLSFSVVRRRHIIYSARAEHDTLLLSVMKCLAIVFWASLSLALFSIQLALAFRPTGVVHRQRCCTPSTSLLQVSQVPPLENQSSVDTTTAEEDEGEFLLLRNRESLRQAEEEHRLRYEQHRRLQQQHNQQHSLADSLLENSHLSFKNVEHMSESLFTNQPVVALVIFLSLGSLVAYMSGLVFLDGYISSLNPAQNGGVPYWNENLPTDEDSILLLNSLHEIKDKLPSLWFWD